MVCYKNVNLKIPNGLVYSLIIPHGIFEIPAIIIARVAGFKISYEIVRYLTGKKEQVLIKDDVR
jgi:uncharacterized membrane protein SpoIIM required for sporulation